MFIKSSRTFNKVFKLSSRYRKDQTISLPFLYSINEGICRFGALAPTPSRDSR